MDEIIKRPESAEDARREAEIRDNFAGEPTLWPVPTLLRFLDSERAKSEGLRVVMRWVSREVRRSITSDEDERQFYEEVAERIEAALSASPSPRPPSD